MIRTLRAGLASLIALVFALVVPVLAFMRDTCAQVFKSIRHVQRRARGLPSFVREYERRGMRSRKLSNGLAFLFGDSMLRVPFTFAERITNFVACLAARTMARVRGWFARGVTGTASALRFAFADGSRIEDLQRNLQAISTEMSTIRDAVTNEKREYTPEETERINALFASFERTEAAISVEQRVSMAQSRLNAPAPRKADAADASVTRPTNAAPLPSGRIEGGDAPGASERGTSGFPTMGHFALAVKAAAGGAIDSRLRVLNAAASTFGQEGVGADGGYLVPPDFRTTIMKKVMGEEQLLSRTDQQQTSSNSITFPTDETTPWQSTGGVQAFWENESGTFPQSKPGVGTTTVRANKLTALVPITDELLEDAPSLEAYLRSKAPDKLNFKINDALVNGDGVGKPTGIMKAAARVDVPAEGGQTAGTIVFLNIVKMWARMPAWLRSQAVWLTTQDAEPLLQQMVVPGGSPAFPAYVPSGGLSDSPYAKLMGRPILYTEACQNIGTPGDIICWAPQTYLTVLKSGGVRTDVSMHLWFDQNLTAFRFVIRVGGAPWWATSVARSKSSNQLSGMVALAAR
jgi:HK97 family phage major capsid protein